MVCVTAILPSFCCVELPQTNDVSALPNLGDGLEYKCSRPEATMPHYFFIWTQEIINHLAEHEVTPEEF